MRLSTYQRSALETDHTEKNFDHEMDRGAVVSMLGLAGELGTLCTTYKKKLRDGEDFKYHDDHIKEELGDTLWYLAVVSNKFGISLDEVAKFNIEKIQGRWKGVKRRARHYDVGAPASQRLPRKFEIVFTQHQIDGKLRAVMRMGDVLLGDPLTDNADEEDGYRFHDAFHIAFLTVLGWSPVLRKLMGRKRRFDKLKDENQDGGRAIVIEEGIAALVFEYGSDNGLSNGKKIIDDELLSTIMQMVRRLEVADRSSYEWQNSVLLGWKMFSYLKRGKGGRLICDLDKQDVRIKSLRVSDKKITSGLLRKKKDAFRVLSG
ncbi:MAG: MazG nucleotide pyrophosphohydrolase domain-containing protein [Dyella sp.]|uniref:nucleoside triphosphate pyrophosphohydrolase family protein n=1 Tax=Dyella sp. TaxID=1869338 RepID=UPI003F7D920B